MTLVMDIIWLRNYAKAKALVEAPDSSEESLKASGLSDSLIAEVMDNIERDMNG